MKNKVEQELRQLILDNPELEIFPLCSDEASNADYGWCGARLYKCSVDEWAISDLDEERILLKSTDYSDFEDSYIYAHATEDSDPTDEEIKTAYEGIEWRKAILIWIDSL